MSGVGETNLLDLAIWWRASFLQGPSGVRGPLATRTQYSRVRTVFLAAHKPTVTLRRAHHIPADEHAPARQPYTVHGSLTL
jgi:hypothetical protein